MHERREMHIGFYWEKLKGRDHLKDLVIDGRISLKLILNKLEEHGIYSSGSGLETVSGLCKHGNKPHVM
jgi:hypothetical protein